MDQELFKLCNEVYKAHHFWAGTDMIYGKEGGSDWRIMPLTLSVPKRYRIPMYTTDYLLSKLPPAIWDRTSDGVNRVCLLTINMQGNGEVTAVYEIPYDEQFRGTYSNTADTALKALLKLTLALTKAGELK